MANISFANLSDTFTMWFEEIDNHATEKLPDTFYTNTASYHQVTLEGENLAYQNGVPTSGHVDSIAIKLGGPKPVPDILITDINANFGAYAQVVAGATTIDRTMALWTATLAGNDNIDFGSETTARNNTINFAGDGYEAPDGRVGGNDVLHGDIFEGLVEGDFFSIGLGRTAYGGNDTIKMLNSAGGSILGDIVKSEYGSTFFAGDDRIVLDRHGYATGDASEVHGVFEAGDDTILGGDENDQLIGDINYVSATAKVRFGNDLIRGGDGDDYIAGDAGLTYSTNYIAGNDTLHGDGGNDSIYAGDGNDRAYGGTGADYIDGDIGNDILRGGDGVDTIVGGYGSDTADFSDKKLSVEVVLDDYGAARAFVGGAAEDKLAQIENLIGGSGNDNFLGFSIYTDNVFDGRAGNDTLDGGGGRDTLIGGAGKDKLTGGIGADQFRFNAKLGADNVDKVTDFTRGTDKIALDDAIFKALGRTFEKGEFVALASGHAANDAFQHVIYDKAHGTLWYDSDGKGGHAAIKFAQLGTGIDHPATLGWHDFAIV